KGGLKSLFYVPAAIAACQLALTLWLETKARRSASAGRLAPQTPAEPEQHPHTPAEVNRFLRMSWLANPCAYVAINTLVALMPGIAGRLGLSTMLAGFSGSVWCFARLGAFWLFWVWAGWHYRFRWLFSAYLGLVSSFALILVVPSLAVLVAAQLVFGLAIGLIYYSSLFYSMDASETKGEHGGIHEAAIGLGNFAGPAVGAASLHFLPQHASSGAVAVTLLLLGGLAALGVIWRRNRP
ncbi:MAG TPA: hypothetical protein PK689_07570, partial [Kiritimatiellia bacterium]|nr:hypothetical protein [Kiritimatiellia bacterium]